MEVPSGVAECTFIFGHRYLATRGHNTCECCLPHHYTSKCKVIKEASYNPHTALTHCAGLKPGKEDKLSFVVAKEGATKFEFLPEGHFSSAHGSITLMDLHIVVVFTIPTLSPMHGSHEVHIVVIKKLSLALQVGYSDVVV